MSHPFVVSGPFVEALRCLAMAADFAELLPVDVRAGGLGKAIARVRALQASHLDLTRAPARQGVLTVAGQEIVSASIDERASLSMTFNPAGASPDNLMRKVLQTFDQRMTCELRPPPLWGRIDQVDWESVRAAARGLGDELRSAAQSRTLAGISLHVDAVVAVAQAQVHDGHCGLSVVGAEVVAVTPATASSWHGVIASAMCAPLAHVEVGPSGDQFALVLFSRAAAIDRSVKGWVEAQARIRRSHVATVDQWVRGGASLSVQLSREPYRGLPKVLHPVG
jgi:hypothetical protein